MTEQEPKPNGRETGPAAEYQQSIGRELRPSEWCTSCDRHLGKGLVNDA